MSAVECTDVRGPLHARGSAYPREDSQEEMVRENGSALTTPARFPVGEAALRDCPVDVLDHGISHLYSQPHSHDVTEASASSLVARMCSESPLCRYVVTGSIPLPD